MGSGQETRILICEDDKNDLRMLQEAISRFFIQNSYLGTPSFTIFTSGEAFLAATREPAQFDIAFLDIFMDKMTGMEVAEEIRKTDNKIHIIFLTTSIDYAVDSYDVQATGYLVKPLQEDKFDKLLTKVFGYKPQPKLIVKQKKDLRYLYYDEIVYADSEGRNLHIHVNNRPSVTILKKLDILEERLDDHRFLRCHQSFLVNMDYITDVTDTMFILTTHEAVPIRQRDYAKMKSEYHRYFVEHHLTEGQN